MGLMASKRSMIILSFACALSLWGELPLSNLSLQDAEAIACEYNKQFLIAQEGTKQAKEKRLQALSRYFPAVHYRGEFRDIQKEEYFFDIFSTIPTFSHRGYSSIFELDQPIFSTNLIFDFLAQKNQEEAVRYEQASTLNELLRAVRQSYYAVVNLEISLNIERENIDYLAYALDVEQKRLEAGNATTLEVNQSKTALANAISTYYLTLKDLKNARNAFVLTLGIDPLLESKIHLSQREMPLHSIPEISLKLQQMQERYRYQTWKMPSTEDFLKHIDGIEQARTLVLFSETEVMEYLETALKNRPDLHSAKFQVNVAKERLKDKQGQYLPVVDGYVRYSYNDVILGTVPFGQQPYFWSAGVVLSWNLFDSLLREHEIREARAVKHAYSIRYDKEYQKIEVEVRNGLYQFEESIMAYLSSGNAVQYAKQAREQAAEKLSFGKIPPLDYRDAVNQLSQARNQNNRAAYELIAAHYQLRYALGLDAEALSKFGTNHHAR